VRCRKARWFLSARCDETLSERQRLRLEAHLVGCEECRREAFYFSEIAVLAGKVETRPVRPDFDLRLKAAIRRADAVAAAPIPWSQRISLALWRPALAGAAVLVLVLGSIGAYTLMHDDEAKYLDSSRTAGGLTPQYGLSVDPNGAALPEGSLVPVDGFDPETQKLRDRYLQTGQMSQDYVTQAVSVNDSNAISPAHRYVLPTVTAEQVAKKASY